MQATTGNIHQLLRILVAASVCTLLVGCATSVTMRAASPSALVEKAEASTRVWADVPPQQAAAAARAVVRAIYERATIAEREGLVSARRTQVMAIGGNLWVVEDWTFAIQPAGSGSKVTITAVMRMLGNQLPDPTPPAMPVPMTDIHGMTPSEARLVLDRMEYVLGLRADWPGCSLLPEREQSPGLRHDTIVCGRLRNDAPPPRLIQPD